jgi:hypothetical protein
MRRGDFSRIQVLSRRVGWLDRYRRTLAISITVVLCPVMLLRVSDVLGADWPRFHGTMIAAIIGIGMWAITETFLAWMTAVWETECAQLMRDESSLPRAIVRTPRALARRHKRRVFAGSR